MKIFSIPLLALSGIIVNRTIKGNFLTYIGIVAGIYLCKDYIIYSSYIFETGLITVSLVLLLYFLLNEKIIQAIYLSGILYLIRPELALVTVGIDLLILYKEKDRKRNFIHMILSAILLLVYTGYMFIQTGTILPSSITGRVLYANDLDYTIWEKWKRCLCLFWFFYEKIFKWIVVLLIPAVLLKGKRKKPQNIEYVIVVLILLLLPHILMPSVNHIIRYTIGIVVFFLLFIGYEIKIITTNRHWMIKGIVLVCCLYTLNTGMKIFHQVYSREYSQGKFDILFGKDLKEQLEEIGITKGTILMYEIQQQLELDGFRGISMDAIVGSEMLDYLNKEENLAQVVKRENINYIVCHQSALTLQGFDGTEIQKLYRKGMKLKVGESVEIDGIRYKKILENDANTKPYVIVNLPYIPEDNVVVYGEGELWEGGTLFWQTVYEVEDITENE